MNENNPVNEEKRIIFSTGMQRDSSNLRARFDLIIPFELPYQSQMLTRWADLMARGAKHYEARNWEKAETQEELDRFIESAFRHFMQWLCEERGEDHAAAVFFNIQGAEYTRWKMVMKGHRESELVPGPPTVGRASIKNQI